MEFWIEVRDGRLAHVAFVTTGCGSSRACGSMTTELAVGKTIEEALRMGQQDVLAPLEPFPEESRHCALLAANTLHAACRCYEQSGLGDSSSFFARTLRQLRTTMLEFWGVSSSGSKRKP